MPEIRPLQLARPKTAELAIPGHDPWNVDPKDPATAVMTDFHERSAITVSEYAPIDKALEHMRHAGVRSAFAIDEKMRRVVGMITAYDIMGEKPFRHLEMIDGSQSETWRDDVLVRDVMEKVGEWRVLTMADIERATVGSVLAAFNEAGRSHIPVIESSPGQGERLRGLFSAARIKRLVRG
jgi:CBS domain-containing protein